MKRLGIVAAAEPDHGGQFQYTLAMIQALYRLRGWQLTIYRKPGVTAYNNFGLEERDLHLGKIHALGLALLRAIGLRTADRFRDEDIVIAPMYASQLLHTRKPFCYTLHDLQEYYFPNYFSFYQRIWRRFLHGRLTRYALRVICESNFVRRDIIKFLQVPDEKICVLPAPPLWEGIDREVDDLAAVSDRYNLPNCFLFYPAQFWAHKNHIRLLEAFARIRENYPELHLVFTGSRRFEYDNVMQKVAQLGLGDRVRHVGYIESADILSVYRLALALVMPSLFESISIPVYEAFRAGTPVCASGILGLADQIGTAGITFDPASVDEMTQAMRTIVGDDDLRRTLVARGKGSLAGLTLDSYARELQGLLAELSRP